jgi:hypothetical protein
MTNLMSTIEAALLLFTDDEEMAIFARSKRGDMPLAVTLMPADQFESASLRMLLELWQIQQEHDAEPSVHSAPLYQVRSV